MSVALPWMDSFDLSTDAAIVARWNAWQNNAGGAALKNTGGRTGHAIELRNSSYLQQTFPNETLVVAGFAVYITAAGCTILQVGDGGSTHAEVRVDGGMTVSVYNGAGVLLGTSNPVTQLLVLNTWTYIEFRVFVHNTLGRATVRVNEVEWVNVSNVDTQNTANAYANSIRVINTNFTPNNLYDDFYLSGGSVLNYLGYGNFWGNQKIEARFANAVGSKSEWSRGGSDSGSNYGQIDETAHNSDTDYVYHSTVGTKDRYGQPGLPGAASGKPITAVQVTNVAKKSDVLERQIQIIMYAGGRDYYSDGKVLTTSYAHYYHMAAIDPSTGTYWTYDGLKSSAFQFGTHLYQ